MSLNVILQRDKPLEKVVFGKLNLTWLAHHPDIYTIVPYPAIPAGVYNLIGHNTQLHPDVWEVANVPDHTGILIHSGNFACEVKIGNTVHKTDSENCILPGFSLSEDVPMVLRSKECMEYLRTILGVTPHGKPTNIQIVIRDYA